MTSPIVTLSARYGVAGSLAAEDFASIAAQGFGTIVSFLPDDERQGLCAKSAAAYAASCGLSFVHVPAAKFDLFNPTVAAQARQAFAMAKGPVLGTCASGQRAAIVWAAAMVGSQPVDDVLEALRAAGFNLGFLRDDLETLAQLARLDTSALPYAA